MNYFLVHKNHILISILLVFFIAVSFYGYNSPGRFSSDKLIYHEEIKKDIYRGDYVDKKGKIAFATDKHYASIIKQLNSEGYSIKEMYFDQYGDPVKQPSGHYGILKEYNLQGKISKITYVDYEGQPVVNSAGYTILKRLYDDNNRIQYEMYYDENEQPVAVRDGYYGKMYKYEEFNDSPSDIYYVDMYYRIMALNNECAHVKNTYNTEGLLMMEQYYDKEGNHIALEHGQYGIKFIGKKKYYLTANGKVLFNHEVLINNSPWIVIAVSLLLCIIVVWLSLKLKIIFLFFLIAFILYETMAFRQTGSLNLELFWSYKQFFNNYNLRLEILNNIWLFVPFGAGLYSLIEKKSVVFISLLLSSLIELSQYIFGLGLCEFDDMISNTLGGAFGICIAYELKTIYNKMGSHIYIKSKA